MWRTLHRFGYKDICEELGAATTATNLHRLENVLTLDPFVHQLLMFAKPYTAPPAIGSLIIRPATTVIVL